MDPALAAAFRTPSPERCRGSGARSRDVQRSPPGIEQVRDGDGCAREISRISNTITEMWHDHRPASMAAKARRAPRARRFGSVRCQTMACVSATTLTMLGEMAREGCGELPPAPGGSPRAMGLEPDEAGRTKVSRLGRPATAHQPSRARSGARLAGTANVLRGGQGSRAGAV